VSSTSDGDSRCSCMLPGTYRLNENTNMTSICFYVNIFITRLSCSLRTPSLSTMPATRQRENGQETQSTQSAPRQVHVERGEAQAGRRQA